MNDKVAIVTGGSSGMGLAISQGLKSKLFDGFADRAYCNSAGRCDGLLTGIASVCFVSAFAEVAIHIKSNQR